jgi:prepilin peptidase CpaA
MVLGVLLDYAPLLGLLLAAAFIDARRRRIPNWLTFGLILSGLCRAAVVIGPSGVGPALAGILAGGAVPLILFALGALGGGDVKLLAGVGAWMGATGALAVFTATCVIGLFLILGQALMQRRTVALFRNSAVLAVSLTQRGLAAGAGETFSSIDRPMPYAVPVTLGTVAVLLGRAVWNGN